MDSPAQYRRWLAKVTYKPGYQLSMIGLDFHVHWAGDDAWGAGRRGGKPGTEYVATVDGVFGVPPGLDRDEFYRVISDVILRYVEDHERMEWFKVDGTCLRDPHGPDHFVLTDEAVVAQAEALLGSPLGHYCE